MTTQRRRRVPWRLRLLLALLLLVLVGILASVVVLTARGLIHFGPHTNRPLPTPTTKIIYPDPCKLKGKSSQFVTATFLEVTAYDKATTIPPAQGVSGGQLHLKGRFVAVTMSLRSKKYGLGCLYVFGQWAGPGGQLQKPVLVADLNIGAYSAKPIFGFNPKVILDLNHPRRVKTNGDPNSPVPVGARVTLTMQVSDNAEHLAQPNTHLTFTHL